MLRAVRFAARLGFELDGKTAAAIKARAGEIGQVSCERIREELTRILTEGGAARGFELLYELGLLQEVLPEVVKLRGVEQPPEFHPEGGCLGAYDAAVIEAGGGAGGSCGEDSGDAGVGGFAA